MSTNRVDSVSVDAGTFDLHLWLPAGGSGPGILLIQEIFGVGAYIRSVADRLAAAGYVVGAPDVFWRFAPGYAADHTEAGLAASFEKMQQLDVPLAVDDCAAALQRLSALPETTEVGVLGFCLGGTIAWAVAATGDPACCVSYYGSGVPDMLDLVPAVSCPTLFHFGNADPFLPSAGIEALNEAIAGREGFVINVENAGHAFDNHEAEMFYDESAATTAWTKTMAFLGTNLPVTR